MSKLKMANPATIVSVGEFLSSIFKEKAPALREEDKQRIIAIPPEIISDEANKVFKIRLADGKFLNIHIVVPDSDR